MKKKRFSVEDTETFMIARAERQREEAERLLEHRREEGDYYTEKVAAKVVAFARAEEEFVRRYAELRKEYTEVARILEERKPYLSELYADADRAWGERNTAREQ